MGYSAHCSCKSHPSFPSYSKVAYRSTMSMETTGSLLCIVGTTSRCMTASTVGHSQTTFKPSSGRYTALRVEHSRFMCRVQQQQGGADCGLFSIAYAYCLAAGEDPTKIKFNQPQMRKHLAECLRNNLITNFPVDKAVTRAARPDIHML